jgi:hypothetical protein
MKRSKKEILKKLRQEGSVLTPDILNNVYKAIGVDPIALGEKEKIIEKRLRSEADAFVPQQKVYAYATDKKPRLSLKSLFHNPRFVSVFATAMVVVILSVTFISLGLNGFFVGPTDTSTDTDTSTNTHYDSVPQPIQNDQQVYSVGALTANVLFDYVEDTASMPQLKALVNDADVDIVLNQFPPYLEMVEQLLSSDGEMETISEVSERDGYDLKETVIAYDLLGSNLNYTLYYNVESIDEESEEATYFFTGIIIYGNSTDEYDIEGRRVIEEDESKVIMTIHYDAVNYIQSIFKFEEDGSKYNVKLYENDELVSETKLKIETDESATKLKLDFIDTDDKNSYSYDISFDEDAPEKIFVRYHIKLDKDNYSGTMEISIVINDETGEYEYEIVVKPNGGQEATAHEGRGNNHGGNGNGGGNGGGN